MNRGEKVCAFIEQYFKIPEGAQVGPPIMCDLQHKFLNALQYIQLRKFMPINCTLMRFYVAVAHAKSFHTIAGVQS